MARYSPVDIQQNSKSASVYFELIPLNSGLSTLEQIAGNGELFLSEPSGSTIFDLPTFDNVESCRIYNTLSGGAQIVNTAVVGPYFIKLEYLAHENLTRLNGVERRCNYSKQQYYTDLSIRNLKTIEIYDTYFYHTIGASDIAANANFIPDPLAVNRVTAFMKVRVDYKFLP